MEEINIKDLFNFFISKIKIIGIIVGLFVILGVLYVKFLQVPMYHSATTLILVSDNNNNNSAAMQSDINLNKNLVSTYSEIVKSRTVLKQVKKELKLDMSIKELSKQIEVTSVENTEIIRIEVSDEDNKLAQKIAEEVAKTFMNEVKDIYNLTNITIIDKASLEKKPYNVSMIKQVGLFGISGLVIGSIVVFLIFYFDTSIKSSKDIEEKLGLPVIGNVTLIEKKK